MTRAINNNQIHTMKDTLIKAVVVKAHGQVQVGQSIELEPNDFGTLYASGHVLTVREHEQQQAEQTRQQVTVKARETRVDNAIVLARKAGRLLPQEDATALRAKAIKLEAAEEGMGIDYILELPIKAKDDELEQRRTAPGDAPQTTQGNDTLDNLMKGYVKASEPFIKASGGLVRAASTNVKGLTEGLKEATVLSKIRASFAQRIAQFADANGGDFLLKEELIKAAGSDYVDSTGYQGTLNTGLVLTWNLGYLANMLPMLNDITTDVSNQPVLFEQQAITRYIVVPGVQLKTSANAWTGSKGNAKNVNVLMDTYAGVPLTVNNTILGATYRQLFNEQRVPQMYGLAEYIIYKLVNCALNGSTRINNDNSTSNVTFNPAYTSPGLGAVKGFSVQNANLATFTSGLPNAMNLAKFPGGDENPGQADLMRFAWVHPNLYSVLTADGNFLLNQSIWGAVKGQGGNALETGRYQRVGNIKFSQSQLISDKVNIPAGLDGSDGDTHAITIDPGDYNNAKVLGLAGTRSSLLFVSRVPINYAEVMPEIPSTAAIEMVTEPRTGITFMVVKYLDHGYENANMRVALMFGVGIGDERQGMLLRIP
jgi:hypothetical protein